jgi:hypothetical protein
MRMTLTAPQAAGAMKPTASVVLVRGPGGFRKR